MTDKSIQEAVEAYFQVKNKEDFLVHIDYIEPLIDLATRYLSVKCPEKKGYGVRSKEHINHHFHGEAQCFECDENKGYNQALDEYDNWIKECLK